MLLDVRDLKTYYNTAAGDVRAVDGVSFSVAPGESLGLVGESGCGKTTVVKSLIRVLGHNARTVGGQIMYKGQDLLALNTNDLNRIRWQEISYVAQSAMNALNPVHRVGDQIVETLRVHTTMSKADAWERAAELFVLVGLERKRLQDYPHQLSGGMRQRVVIALALALNPALVIADEPTTALDVVVQDGILKQMRHIQQQLGNSMILVTHDISVVAELCQRMAVMYAGHVVEIGTTRELFYKPSHPYTMGLLNAFPTLESAAGELIAIPGAPPNLLRPPAGCRFAPRCPFATELCQTEVPEPVEVSPGHIAACHYVDKAEQFRSMTTENATWQKVARRLGEAGVEPQVAETTTVSNPDADGVSNAPKRKTGTVRGTGAPPTLAVRDVRRLFPLQQGGLSSLFKGTERHVHAVDGVNLEVAPGEILGLAGESGSGKSTLAEVIVGLQRPTAGYVDHEGVILEAAGRRTSGRVRREQTRVLQQLRRHVQMVFQDPYETLNPRFTIYQTIVEPLRNFGIGTEDERVERVKQALREAELSPPEDFMDRYPHELSGGQRQRVAIARGIVVQPRLLVADEPVSMLDVSVRAGILNLFRRFREEMGTALVYVSHDLATIRYLCDRTAILYLGRIAEIGPTEAVITTPRHPYTELLLAAVPRPEPDGEREHVDARGEIPDAIELPNGCRFHARCAYAMAHCGWEGRDLIRFVERRTRELTAAEMMDMGVDSDAPVGNVAPNLQLFKNEAELLDAIDEMKHDGPNATFKIKPGAAAAEDMAELLRHVMKESGTTIGEAVQSIDVRHNEVYVRFSVQEEPPYYDVGDGHQIACHLYAEGVTSPLADQSAS